MNLPLMRLGLASFVLMWFAVTAQQPSSAQAIEVPNLGPSIYTALEHLEFELPAAPGVHTVEYWNGVVCEQDDAGLQDYRCTAPPISPELGE